MRVRVRLRVGVRLRDGVGARTTDMSLMNMTVGSPCTRRVLATTGSSSASILSTRTWSERERERVGG